MDKVARAQHAQNLLDDPVLTEAFNVILSHYQSAFRDVTATDDEVIDARRSYMALEMVKTQLRRYVVDGKIEEKKRDQHRVND